MISSPKNFDSTKHLDCTDEKLLRDMPITKLSCNDRLVAPNHEPNFKTEFPLPGKLKVSSHAQLQAIDGVGQDTICCFEN